MNTQTWEEKDIVRAVATACAELQLTLMVVGASARDVIRETGRAGKRLLDWLDPERPPLQEKLIRAFTSVLACKEQHAVDVLRAFRSGIEETTAEPLNRTKPSPDSQAPTNDTN